MTTNFDKYIWELQTKFSDPPSITWGKGWLKNSYCPQCRYCCGPQENSDPFPMALLPHQIHPGIEEDFFMMNANTAFMDGRGCKSSTAYGCRLPRVLRPIACNIFPLVIVDGAMYLYAVCPSVLFLPLQQWHSIARQAAAWLGNFEEKDLRHISISLPHDTLIDRYIFMHVTLFGQQEAEAKSLKKIGMGRG